MTETCGCATSTSRAEVTPVAGSFVAGDTRHVPAHAWVCVPTCGRPSLHKAARDLMSAAATVTCNSVKQTGATLGWVCLLLIITNYVSKHIL